MTTKVKNQGTQLNFNYFFLSLKKTLYLKFFFSIIYGRCGGNRPGNPYNIYVGPRAQSKEESLLGNGKNPSLVMGKTLPRSGVAEDKRNGLLLRVTLRVILWNRISTKIEKDNGRNGNI